ncbi:MAG: VWA domain-containing protein [Elusimicrobiota bacterium]|jgi:Ca-activated chloride channel family protein|nr:VWA domain-containing protein [Elusimicrobiota bacterium]
MKLTKKTALKGFYYLLLLLIVLAALSAIFLFVFDGVSFANPWVLYFLPLFLVLALLAWAVKYFYQPAIKYPLGQNVKTPFSVLGFVAKWLPFSLCLAALLLMLIALARPRSEAKTVLPPLKGVDIILTIDTSQSMDALDFQPDRMGAAKTTADEFVKKRSSDKIGVVVFAETAMLQCPLTLDYFAVHDYINMINIGMLGVPGGTAIGDAIAVSTMHLKGSPTKSKIIILLTDGESNSGTVDPMAAAKAAQSYGIKIYTIAIAGDGAVQRPVDTFFGTQYVTMPPSQNTGEPLLMEISKMTGGEFFRAKNNIELQNIYDKINELEKTDFKESSQLNYKDIYYPLLMLAALMLILATILDKFIFIKIP